MSQTTTNTDSTAYVAPDNMVDDQAPSSTSVTNTIFMEQRATNLEEAQHQNLMGMSSLVSREMADEHWYAKQQLSKPVLLTTLNWQPSDAPDSILYEAYFPQMISSVDSLMKRTLSMYAFFKMSPVFRIQVNATQFHQGQLIASFDPFGQSTKNVDLVLDTRPYFTRFYATGLPNVKIMASESSPVELHVPYIHPASYLTTNATDTIGSMGYFRLCVLNALFSPTGPVSVSIWLYAADAEVHVPVFYHEPVFNGLIKDGARAGVNLIGNVLTGQWGKAISDGKRDASDAIDKYMDYPNQSVTTSNSILPLENLASSSGVSRSHRLALNQDCGTLLDSSVSASTDDNADILKIARTPMIFDQIVWQASASSGDLLYSFPVNPNNFYKTVLASYYQPTFLCYIADAFVQWRGSIQIDLEFVATHFHSGKLLVGFIPNNGSTGTPTMAQVATNNPLITIDLQQSSSVSFTIPYVSANPYKVVATSSLSGSSDASIGWVHIFVQNRLVAASNVRNAVDINLYARGGPDFEVAIPNGFDSSLNFHDTPVPELEPTFNSDTTVKVQTDRVSNTDQPAQAILSMGPGMISPRRIYNEDYNLYSICKRPSVFRTFHSRYSPLTTEMRINTRRVGNNPTLFFASPLCITTDDPFTNPSKLAYFSSLFSAWSGSLRFKFTTAQPRTSVYYLTATHFPYDGDGAILTEYLSNYYDSLQEDGGVSGYGATRTNLAQNNTLEFELPFYSRYNMLLVRPPSEVPFSRDSGPTFASGLFSIEAGNYSNSSFDIYANAFISGGEDFRLHYLRAPPARSAEYLPRPTLENPNVIP